MYSIYARHVPNMGYPYAPYTGHRHAKDTCFDPTIGSTPPGCAQRQRIVSTCDCSGSSAKLEGREFWLEKTSVAGEGRLRKPISDSLRVVLRVVLIFNTERKRGR